MNESHAKLLTKNDTGFTGGHQGGITIPRKNLALLNFFPKLDVNEFNPDAWIFCKDPDGEIWKMRYVYYNGKTFSPQRSTRNEYRITYMTKYFAKWSATFNDSIIFTSTNKANHYDVSLKKDNALDTNKEIKENRPVVLRGWSRVF